MCSVVTAELEHGLRNDGLVGLAFAFRFVGEFGDVGGRSEEDGRAHRIAGAGCGVGLGAGCFARATGGRAE